MSTKQDFETAAADVKKLTKRPSNDDLLELYALFKQSTEGDVTGSRPGMLDLKGRKKFDTWAQKKGMAAEAAMLAYVKTVRRLEKELA